MVYYTRTNAGAYGNSNNSEYAAYKRRSKDSHAFNAETDQPRAGLDIRSLLSIKRKAIRKGVWFRALSGIERGKVNLAVRCLDTIRGSLLMRTLASIYVKLLKAMNFSYRLEAIGRPIAERLSEAFAKWGNKEALKWKFDRAYAIHLGLDRMNSPWSMRS